MSNKKIMKPISKSQFLDYLTCPKDAWFRIHKSDLKEFEVSATLQNMFDQGYEAEALAERLKAFSGMVEEESIVHDGGMGLLTYLAHEAGVESYSPEPSEHEERAELEKYFSREEIQYYYFARAVDQWTRKAEPRLDLEIYIESFLRADARGSGWNDFDFSFANMKAIHHRLFGTEVDPSAEDFWYSVTNPVSGPSVINQVAGACSHFRDEHIVKEIVQRMQNGESIFAQYGYSHVVMQEPLLRALLKA